MDYLTPMQRRKQGISTQNETKYLTPLARRTKEQYGTTSVEVAQNIKAAQEANSQQKLRSVGLPMDLNKIAPKAPETKTPINQTLTLIKSGNKTLGDFWLGNNLIQAYKEDSPLKKIGKGIVNYGLGTVANIFGAPQQAMMQTDRAVVNAVTGKKQDFTPMSFGKDILGAKEENIGTMILGTALDPTTYVGGGILDDMARAGSFGKGATLGTSENLAANAATGQRASKGLSIKPQQSSAEYLKAENRMRRVDNNTARNAPSAGNKGTFFATPGGSVSNNLSALNTPPKQVPMLPAGNPAAGKSTGQFMIDLGRRSVGLPVYGDAKGLREAPFTATPNQTPKLEVKTGQSVQGESMNAVLNRLENIQKKSDEMLSNNPLQQPYNPGTKAPTGSFNMTSGIKKQSFSPKRSWNTFYNKTVSNTSFVDKAAGKQGTVAVDVARNAGGTVENSIKSGFVDMEGKKVVGSGLSEIYNMPKAQQEALDQLLFHKHNIDRLRQGKPLDPNITAVQSRQAIKDIIQTYPGLENRAATVRETLDKVLDEWGVKSGLVSPELRDVLRSMYPDYVPSNRVLSGTNTISYKSRGMGPAKIVNQAVGGDEPLQLLQESIPTLINKVVKASRKNEVYKTILDAARTNPKNGYASILEPAGQIKAAVDKALNDSVIDTVKADGLEGLVTMSDKALEADPKLGYILTVMENGKPIKLSITEDLYNSLKGLDKADDNALGNIARGFKKWATNPVKSLITGYNPLFAVRNVARDIPTAYIQGTENNPFKFMKNLYDAGKDMAKGTDRFQEYKNLGGTGGNFFNIERGISPEGKLSGVKKVIGAINNATETLPRYAEYIGTLKRGGSGYANKLEALHNAQEVTTNFGRHGDYIKAADAFIPYLNPAVQGLDKFIRTMKNPAAVAKSLGVVTIPTTAMYLINQSVDKEGYDRLDNRTKDTYFLIPQGDGQFIKIPKTREAGVLFGALFERLYRLAQGKEDSFKGFGKTIRDNFIPNNPVTSNILYPAVQAMGDNGKDFAGRDVVPQALRGYSPRYQYDNKTSEISKAIGNAFNISPKKLDYLAKSYLGIIGQAGIPLTTKANYTGLKGVLTSPFTADSLYNNEIQNDFYNNLDKLQTTQKDSSLTGQAYSENLYSGMNRVNDDMSTIRAIMKQIEADPGIGDQDKQAMLRGYQRQLVNAADAANATVKGSDNSLLSKYPETRGQYYPEKSFSYNGQKITMNPDEYEAFKKTASDNFTKMFNMALLSKSWAGLPDDTKEEMIKNMISKANSIAKNQILQGVK